MGLPRSNDGEARFSAYVEGLTRVIGHADRAKPLRDYCLGLMMPCERKWSRWQRSQRQNGPQPSISRCCILSAREDGRTRRFSRRCGNWCCRTWNATGRSKLGSSTTSFPKKGQHSVGVARQYCGELGKQDNCQVAVTLSIANHDASLPVAYRLYLPKEWASDRKRRRKVGVPDEISFKTKPEIALTQIRWACEAGLPRGAVLMDAGYGVDTDLRTSLTALGLSYVA